MGNGNKANVNKQIPPAQAQKAKTGGSPIPQPLKHSLETQFGADFSDVRIHTGPNAAQVTKMIGAEAFTIGNHIFLEPGKFQPNTNSGKNLLAHELNHVVQQSKGKIKPSND